jgi:sugar phosphate isomerase/epimerase
MKLSMMSYTMARQPEFFDLEAMFRLTRELNLEGIDLVTLHGRSAEDLRRMADDHGVPVVCHTFMADLNRPTAAARQPGVDDARRGIEAACVLGAPVAMIPTPPKPDEERTAARRRWIEGLRAVAGFSRRAGVTLTVENFPGAASPFVVAADVLEAVREVPGLKITYDCGNAAGGEDPTDSFTRCAEHVVHAHFKDWAPVESGGMLMLDGRRYRPALIGEGSVDHRACLRAMEAAGYRGFINIEYEGNEYRPDEAVRRAAAYLRGIESGLS